MNIRETSCRVNEIAWRRQIFLDEEGIIGQDMFIADKKLEVAT
jgi:hypothetical protein